MNRAVLQVCAVLVSACGHIGFDPDADTDGMSSGSTPEYITTSSSQFGAVADTEVRTPASARAGDLLIVGVDVYPGVATATAPSGWSTLADTGTTNGMGHVYWAAHTIAPGDLPGARFAISNAQGGAWFMVVVRSAAVGATNVVSDSAPVPFPVTARPTGGEQLVPLFTWDACNPPAGVRQIGNAGAWIFFTLPGGSSTQVTCNGPTDQSFAYLLISFAGQ